MFTDTTSQEDDLGPGLCPTMTMTTASTPATPGPSTPTAIRSLPLEYLKVDGGDVEDDIVPPARPSSTPFPQQEILEGHIHFPRHLNNSDPLNPMSYSQWSQAYRITQMVLVI